MATQEEGKRKLSDLGPRVASAVVYAVLVLGCLFIHPLATAILVALMAGICAFEFIRMYVGDGALKVVEWIAVVAAAAAPLLVYFWGLEAVLYDIVLTSMLLLAWHVFDQDMDTQCVCVDAFAVIYCGAMFASLVLIRQMPENVTGIKLSLAVVLGVWLNDVAAYFVGSKLGKHKLMPRISPKKSWEGFIAGVLATLIVWFVVALIEPELGILPALAIGLVCGVANVLGDLIESRIKRVHGVKDSGRIMPGHGGMLDRSDALIFVSALCFCICRIVGVL